MSAARDLQALQLEQVEAIVRSLRAGYADPQQGLCIADVEYTLDRDWSGDEAIHLTVILRDPVGRDEYDFEETNAVRMSVLDQVREAGIERIPYVTFQLESERKAIAEGRYYADSD